MNEKEETKKPVPPYLPYRTLVNFLDGLKVAMPQRIDRSLMKSMSGAMQYQLMSALEYLGLISSDTGIPTEKLTRLVHSTGDEGQQELKDILTSSYRFLFENGLDLDRATTDQLQEGFRKEGASGDTLRKCVTFFLKAARVAGLELSPHFKRAYTRRTGTPRAKRKINIPQEQPKSSDQESAESIPERAVPPESTLLAKMADKILEKFPDFDTSWSAEQQASWFEGMNKLMAQFEKK